MDTNKIKILLFAEREKIKSAHRGGEGGGKTALKLTALTDNTIVNVCSGFNMKDIAVIALGGYGRHELSPHSDVDLLFLNNGNEENEYTIKSILRILWDLRFDLGHSVRTLEDLKKFAQTDIHAKTSFLEARFIFGNKNMWNDFHDFIEQEISKPEMEGFIKSKLEEMHNRHKKYGNSTQLLEPNLKESAGGLRDVHNIIWLFYNGNIHKNLLSGANKDSACIFIINELLKSNVLREEEAERLKKAFNFILKIRHELHYINDTKGDLLRYILQKDIAKNLNFVSPDEFMREYYQNARIIYAYNRSIISEFTRKIIHKESKNDIEKIGENLYSQNGIIFSDDKEIEFKKNPLLLLEIFTEFQQYSALPDRSLVKQIQQNKNLIDENLILSESAGKIFRKILSSNENVGKTLRLMHELEILGKYIPEFGNLTAHTEYDVYHFFTTDEHSIIAVERVEALKNETNGKNNFKKVFEEIKNKDILFLGILFHDIGKGVSIQNHSEIGADITQKILERINFGEGADEVVFLVRNHLKMEQFAFRRNLNGKGTIEEFCKIVRNEDRLKLLFLLSYGDLTALNPSVWTDWKGSLLWELYLKSWSFLTGEKIQRDVEEIKRGVHGELIKHFSNEIAESHIDEMPEEYFHTFGEEEIKSHVKLVLNGEVVSIILKNLTDYSELTVITKDKLYLLAEICGILASNDVSIFDAQIFTGKNGLVIDRFRVVNFYDHKPLSEERLTQIKDALETILKDSKPIEEMFEQYEKKWKFRKKVMGSVEKEVVFENKDLFDYTIIDVSAPDSLGLLYRITKTLSDLKLNIYSAKIATKVDGIIDSFYVKNINGNKVTDLNEQEIVRKRIMEVL
jgi:[protein-PII] uridylyltransferase